MLYNVSLFISYYHVGFCSLYHVLKRLTTAIVTISTRRKIQVKYSKEPIPLEDIQRFLQKEISVMQNLLLIEQIHKGFSKDQKYIIDGRYLLRIFSSDEVPQRQQEVETVTQLAQYSNTIPKVIQFGLWKEYTLGYMLLEYIPGTDGVEALPLLSLHQQYEAGYRAGEELYKLHQCPAPQDITDWYTIKKAKNDRYFQQLQQVNVDSKIKQLLTQYIYQHDDVMKDRPSTFQHDDFHPSNLVIHQGVFAGIIDFGRMDWGDPIHDLQKLSFFSVRVSVECSKGIIDGYHHGGAIPASFWHLLSLYEAIHLVSALVWGEKQGKEQYELLFNYAMDVLEYYDFFQKSIPSWYNQSNYLNLSIKEK